LRLPAASSGLASGLFNTTQPIGGALGSHCCRTIANVATIACALKKKADVPRRPAALVHGFTGASSSAAASRRSARVSRR